MKSLFSIIILGLYVLTTAVYTISVHFCGDNPTDISVFEKSLCNCQHDKEEDMLHCETLSDDSECCDTMASATECCEDVDINPLYRIDLHVYESALKIGGPVKVISLFSTSEAFENEVEMITCDLTDSPPKPPKENYYLLFSTFIFYG